MLVAAVVVFTFLQLMFSMELEELVVVPMEAILVLGVLHQQELAAAVAVGIMHRVLDLMVVLVAQVL